MEVHRENPADHIFVDVDAESQRDLLGNALIEIRPPGESLLQTRVAKEKITLPPHSLPVMNRQARITRKKELAMNIETATTNETTERTAKTKRPTKKAKTAKAAAKATAKTKGTSTRKQKSKPAGDSKKAILVELLRRKEGSHDRRDRKGDRLAESHDSRFH